ncbi:MAG: hypothetical protein SGJ11_07395 [Phycisphaerae bacterium]|nr:hypothetical protein [Phycisphaerae bacterium]
MALEQRPMLAGAVVDDSGRSPAVGSSPTLTCLAVLYWMMFHPAKGRVSRLFRFTYPTRRAVSHDPPHRLSRCS